MCRLGALAAALLATLASTRGALAQDPLRTAPLPAATTATADPAARAAREIERLRSSDPREREAAGRALAGIGREALPAIRAALDAAGVEAQRLRAIEIELDPRSRPREGERWYELKLREAALRLDRGDQLGAWKLLDAILVVEPDCPIRDRIQALKLRSRELYLRANVVAARLVPKKVLLAPGEPLELGLEVKNVSGHPLELAFAGGESDLAGALDVELFEATPSGDRARRRELRPLRFAVSRRLGVNDAWQTTYTLPPLERAPRERFRRITISGSLRPSALSSGEESFYGAVLPLFPVDVVVVAEDFRPIAADPPAALAAALGGVRGAGEIAQRAALEERLFFAALIGATTARDPTIDALALALGDGDPAAPAALRALATISDNPVDRAAVLAWLRRR
jgi:hypothetical protein